MPQTVSHSNLSNRPSSTITRPPPPPSSAGWNIKCTVPSKFLVSARYLAAPSSIVVCPSWPQACILPAFFERCSGLPSSSIGSASMSALRPIDRLLLPDPLSTPTTPVVAILRCTSIPHDSSCCATKSDVLCSSKPNSGCAWISRRVATRSS